MKPIVNIAGYKFVQLDKLHELKSSIQAICSSLGIKGTILLSSEGINLFLAGRRPAIDDFLCQLRSRDAFADMSVKESLSQDQPFSRLLVRIKREIIAFGVEGVEPQHKTSPKILPAELKSWLDEGRCLTLLDVRNNYEVEIGTFQGAVPIDIDHFRQFPDAVAQIPDDLKQQPVVMFCTGGIRCEKAGPMMEQVGFQKVYQLDGGILQYFEDCGGAHYDGECFVFDKRVALDPNLEETDTTVCYACQHVLRPHDLTSPAYQPPASCPFCFQTDQQSMQDVIQNRQLSIAKLVDPLPGSQPYDNIRPINVPARYDRWQLLEFLDGYYAHIPRETWAEKIADGRLTTDGAVLVADQLVRGGQRIDHLIPSTIEPEVNSDIQILYEDESLVIVDKPAPLPMHPSGRYNRNTLVSLLNRVYERPLRAAHRLDANTAGLVVFCKGRHIATRLQSDFERQQVHRVYLAQVTGTAAEDEFEICLPIVDQPIAAGGRTTGDDGKNSVTRFKVLSRQGQTTLLAAYPQTGRTNQIRVHLWQSGFPVTGDPTYQQDRQIRERQTLDVDEPPMCLHAWQIRFKHPVDHRQMEFRSPLPNWAAQQVDKLSLV